MSDEIKNGSISITRVNDGGDGYVMIEMGCNKSHTIFAQMKISLEDFAKVVTGLAGVRGELNTRLLERVGKTEERKSIEVDMPEGFYFTPYNDDSVLKAKVAAEAHTPDGWTLDLNMNSQNFFKDGKIHFTIKRWV